MVPELSREYIDPGLDQEQWGETFALEQLIDNEKRLFILGDPGTGKTTLLNRVCYVLSNLYNEQALERRGFIIPFHLTPRQVKKMRKS